MEKLIGKIYQVAMNDSNLDPLLELIAQEFCATDVHVIVYGNKYRDIFTNHIARNKDAEPDFIERFLAPETNPAIEYFRNNPGISAGQDTDFGPDIFARFREFYEYVDRRDAFYRIGHRFLADEMWDGSIWVLRDKKIGLADQGELKKIDILSQHIRTAVDFINRAGSVGGSIVEMFDALDNPVIIVEQSLRIVNLNKKAEIDLMQSGFSFDRNRKLRMASATADAAVQRAVQSVTDPWSDPISVKMITRNPSGTILYRVCVAPILLPGRFFLPSRRKALILFDEIRAGNSLISNSVSEHFGLTTAEADIASAIASGMTLQMIAKSRATSIETVKTQARAARDKMDVERNIDLALLLQQLAK